MSARFIVGDVFDVLATLEPDSVDLIFSSPPFLALRSYLPADHELKHKEIGSEATPADFLDTLLDVVEACDRVLAPHGSLCFELGDTFSGSGGAGGDYLEGGLRAEQPSFTGSKRQGNPRDDKVQMAAQGIIGTTSGERAKANPGGWPLDKSLCGIPTLFAWSLAYGRNLLRPERETPRWRIRNLVVWARPNPPVGALGDKFRPATSYLTVATKSRTRYFDLDAVREPLAREGFTTRDPRMRGDVPTGDALHPERVPVGNPAGAPPLDYWVIPTAPFKGSHYATFPPDLCVKPIRAMTPLRVCRVCGEPSRRITEREHIDNPGHAGGATSNASTQDDWRDAGGIRFPDGKHVQVETLGWTDCGHDDDYRTGVVLDPFAGSGTTLAVATGHGRDAIGIDLDERNADLALERVGPMFLTVEHLNAEPAA